MKSVGLAYLLNQGLGLVHWWVKGVNSIPDNPLGMQCWGTLPVLPGYFTFLGEKVRPLEETTKRRHTERFGRAPQAPY